VQPAESSPTYLLIEKAHHAATNAWRSIRQHTSAYVSIRQHTSGSEALNEKAHDAAATARHWPIRQHTSGIRQHTSGIRQHTSGSAPHAAHDVFVAPQVVPIRVFIAP
jgi:hypothetical protein